jgi:chromosome segregation and condensation protein ScpB
MKTHTENGQGRSALENKQVNVMELIELWGSKKISFEDQLEALQDSFRAGGLLDLCPVEVGEGWQVSVSDDRGNVLEAVTLQSEKQANGLIDLLILTAEGEAE